MKSINQLLAGANLATACEAITYAIRLGVDPAEAFNVITHSAGNSWIFEDRIPHVLDNDYAPRSATNIFVKDLGIVLESGTEPKSFRCRWRLRRISCSWRRRRWASAAMTMRRSRACSRRWRISNCRNERGGPALGILLEAPAADGFGYGGVFDRTDTLAKLFERSSIPQVQRRAHEDPAAVNRRRHAMDARATPANAAANRRLGARAPRNAGICEPSGISPNRPPDRTAKRPDAR